jgi:hypothetical protein
MRTYLSKTIFTTCLLTAQLVTCSLALAESSTKSVELSYDKVTCLAKINKEIVPLTYNSSLQVLNATKDGINVSVIAMTIDNQIRASAEADIEGKDLLSQTAAIPVESKNVSPFLALFDFGDNGKVSVFCSLK